MRHAVALTIATLLAAASASHAQITTPAVLIGSDATNNEPIQVYNVTAGTFSTLPNGVARMTGLSYNQMTQTAYVAMRTGTGGPSRLFTLPLNPPGTLTLVANYTGSLINGTLGGLAWDPVSQRLFASVFGTIYLVDPATASNSSLRVIQAASGSIKGIDVDPVTGDLYFLHTGTSTTPPLATTGIYRITPPIESGPIVRIAPLPLASGVPDTNIEGLAVGGGYVWISARTGNSLYRLRLSDGVYETPVAVPFTGTGSASGGAAFVGAAVAGADLGVAIHNSADTVIPAPGETTFNITLRNVGTAPATFCNAEIVLPGGVSFVSATNGATFSSGVVSFSAGDLAANASTTFSVTLASASAFLATVVTTTTAGDVYIGNNTASATSTSGSPDMTISMVLPANCNASPGQATTFNMTVTNIGSSAANAIVTVPVPSNATFTTSSPPGVLGAGVVSIDLGAVAAGVSAPVSISFTVGSGVMLRAEATVTATGDSNATNNFAAQQFLIDNFGPATAAATGIFTSITGNLNSAVPGMPGLSFALPATLPSQSSPQRSANGVWLIQQWDTNDLVTTQNNILLRTNLTTGVSDVVAQEGVTTIPTAPTPTQHRANFLSACGINNSGDFAFGGPTNGPTTGDQYIAKSVGGVITVLAQEGEAAPAFTGGLVWGSGLGSPRIANSGATSFLGNVPSLPAGTQSLAFLNNATASCAQTGVTVPSGASGPITALTGAAFFTAANGVDWIYSGSRSANVDIAVIGSGATPGMVAALEGQILPGSSYSSNVSAIEAAQIMAEGRWFVRGTNADAKHWVTTGASVAVTGTVIAESATPITPGSTELWATGSASTNPFIAAVSNPRGDILVVGETNNALTQFTQVMVLNGTTILARESDPIDTNNNGAFDDGFYFRDFGTSDDRIIMTDEAVYLQARFRDRTTVCGGADATTSEYGLVRIPLPLPPTEFCCRGTTCNSVASGTCTGSVAGSNSQVRPSCGGGNSFASCCYADYNHDGFQTIDDLFLYFNAYFTSSPMADFGGTGTSVPTIDDLFLYINAYFGTCS